jgi:phosphoenolpyruvate phosphomutase
LDAKHTSYLLEAHNTCSALIAEEAGFPGVWASSLTLSCAAGLRDDSEISTEHVLYTLESMTDRLGIPILFDGDSGHGGFNQFQILVRRLIRRGVAGVCIEDKLFPKSNSFVDSERQPLCSVAEFVGKLRAGIDARTDPDFVVVARTEALVTGAGMREALRRANAYADAGADAILIHSKARSFVEVERFCDEWDRPTPVICVPTMYPDTSREQLEAAGVRVAIWANHLLRASVQAMQHFATDLIERGQPSADRLVSLDEVFRLQGVPELRAARARYEEPSRAAVVCPSLSGVGATVPPALATQLRAAGWTTIVPLASSSLATFADWLDADGAKVDSLLVVPADLRVRDSVLAGLSGARAEAAILIGAGPHHPTGHVGIWCSAQPGVDDPDLPLLLARTGPVHADMHGTWTGLARFAGRGVEWFRHALREELSAGREAQVEGVLSRLAAVGHPIHIHVAYGGWSRATATESPASVSVEARPRQHDVA